MAAYKKEADNIEQVGDIRPVPQLTGMKPLPVREIFFLKTDNITREHIFKVRICGRGDLLQTKEHDYSSAVGVTAFRAFSTVVANLNMHCRKLDVSGAYPYEALK